MVSKLRKLSSVRAYDKDIGVDYALFLRLAVACHQEPLAVRRQLRRGKALSRLGEYHLLNAGLEVDAPYFALFLVGKACAIHFVLRAGNKADGHSTRVV